MMEAVTDSVFPYPLVIFDRHFDMVMANGATHRLLRLLLGDRAQAERNVLKLLFDPQLLRPMVVQWETIAKALLVRVQREALYRRRDEGLTQLLATLCSYEGVPEEWRAPDLQAAADATLNVRFEVGGQQFGFLVTLTVFQAPQNISLEELQIESYFPLDDQTDAMCRALAASDT